MTNSNGHEGPGGRREQEPTPQQEVLTKEEKEKILDILKDQIEAGVNGDNITLLVGNLKSEIISGRDEANQDVREEIEEEVRRIVYEIRDDYGDKNEFTEDSLKEYVEQQEDLSTTIDESQLLEGIIKTEAEEMPRPVKSELESFTKEEFGLKDDQWGEVWKDKIKDWKQKWKDEGLVDTSGEHTFVEEEVEDKVKEEKIKEIKNLLPSNVTISQDSDKSFEYSVNSKEEVFSIRNAVENIKGIVERDEDLNLEESGIEYSELEGKKLGVLIAILEEVADTAEVDIIEEDLGELEDVWEKLQGEEADTYKSSPIYERNDLEKLKEAYQDVTQKIEDSPHSKMFRNYELDSGVEVQEKLDQLEKIIEDNEEWHEEREQEDTSEETEQEPTREVIDDTRDAIGKVLQYSGQRLQKDEFSFSDRVWRRLDQAGIVKSAEGSDDLEEGEIEITEEISEMDKEEVYREYIREDRDINMVEKGERFVATVETGEDDEPMVFLDPGPDGDGYAVILKNANQEDIGKQKEIEVTGETENNAFAVVVDDLEYPMENENGEFRVGERYTKKVDEGGRVNFGKDERSISKKVENIEESNYEPHDWVDVRIASLEDGGIKEVELVDDYEEEQLGEAKDFLAELENLKTVEDGIYLFEDLPEFYDKYQDFKRAINDHYPERRAHRKIEFEDEQKEARNIILDLKQRWQNNLDYYKEQNLEEILDTKEKVQFWLQVNADPEKGRIYESEDEIRDMISDEIEDEIIDTLEGFGVLINEEEKVKITDLIEESRLFEIKDAPVEAGSSLEGLDVNNVSRDGSEAIVEYEDGYNINVRDPENILENYDLENFKKVQNLNVEILSAEEGKLPPIYDDFAVAKLTEVVDYEAEESREERGGSESSEAREEESLVDKLEIKEGSELQLEVEGESKGDPVVTVEMPEEFRGEYGDDYKIYVKNTPESFDDYDNFEDIPSIEVKIKSLYGLEASGSPHGLAEFEQVIEEGVGAPNIGDNYNNVEITGFGDDGDPKISIEGYEEYDVYVQNIEPNEVEVGDRLEEVTVTDANESHEWAKVEFEQREEREDVREDEKVNDINEAFRLIKEKKDQFEGKFPIEELNLSEETIQKLKDHRLIVGQEQSQVDEGEIWLRGNKAYIFDEYESFSEYLQEEKGEVQPGSREGWNIDNLEDAKKWLYFISKNIGVREFEIVDGGIKIKSGAVVRRGNNAKERAVNTIPDSDYLEQLVDQDILDKQGEKYILNKDKIEDLIDQDEFDVYDEFNIEKSEFRTGTEPTEETAEEGEEETETTEPIIERVEDEVVFESVMNRLEEIHGKLKKESMDLLELEEEQKESLKSQFENLSGQEWNEEFNFSKFERGTKWERKEEKLEQEEKLAYRESEIYSLQGEIVELLSSLDVTEETLQKVSNQDTLLLLTIAKENPDNREEVIEDNLDSLYDQAQEAHESRMKASLNFRAKLFTIRNRIEPLAEEDQRQQEQAEAREEFEQARERLAELQAELQELKQGIGGMVKNLFSSERKERIKELEEKLIPEARQEFQEKLAEFKGTAVDGRLDEIERLTNETIEERQAEQEDEEKGLWGSLVDKAEAIYEKWSNVNTSTKIATGLGLAGAGAVVGSPVGAAVIGTGYGAYRAVAGIGGGWGAFEGMKASRDKKLKEESAQLLDRLQQEETEISTEELREAFSNISMNAMHNGTKVTDDEFILNNEYRQIKEVLTNRVESQAEQTQRQQAVEDKLSELDKQIYEEAQQREKISKLQKAGGITYGTLIGSGAFGKAISNTAEAASNIDIWPFGTEEETSRAVAESKEEAGEAMAGTQEAQQEATEMGTTGGTEEAQQRAAERATQRGEEVASTGTETAAQNIEATSAVEKGEGFLQSVNDIQSDYGTEELADKIIDSHPDWASLSDEQAIHNWRVEQAEKFGISPSEGFKYEDFGLLASGEGNQTTVDLVFENGEPELKVNMYTDNIDVKDPEAVQKLIESDDVNLLNPDGSEVHPENAEELVSIVEEGGEYGTETTAEAAIEGSEEVSEGTENATKKLNRLTSEEWPAPGTAEYRDWAINNLAEGEEAGEQLRTAFEEGGRESALETAQELGVENPEQVAERTAELLSEIETVEVPDFGELSFEYGSEGDITGLASEAELSMGTSEMSAELFGNVDKFSEVFPPDAGLGRETAQSNLRQLVIYDQFYEQMMENGQAATQEGRFLQDNILDQVEQMVQNNEGLSYSDFSDDWIERYDMATRYPDAFGESIASGAEIAGGSIGEKMSQVESISKEAGNWVIENDNSAEAKSFREARDRLLEVAESGDSEKIDEAISEYREAKEAVEAEAAEDAVEDF